MSNSNETTVPSFTDATSNQGANLNGASIVKQLKSFTKEPDAGYRLSRQIAKKDKNGNFGALKESFGVIVPDNLSVIEGCKFESVKEYLKDRLCELQDKVIRKLLEGGETTIHHNKIGYAALAEFAESSEGIGKLSAEKIGNWFEQEIAVAVDVVFCTQVGKELEHLSNEQKEQLQHRKNAVKQLLQGFTARKVILGSEAVRGKLREYLKLSEATFTQRMLERLEDAEIVTDDAL
jgi:hypothetical protein